jgi:metal-sulfur cluster biosynthetic enzyme
VNLWQALGTVRGPELDEPITDLGFVRESRLRDGHATVRLRLPTYFCAPNFAYLMVADADDAVRAAPGVRSADVRLEDHFAAEEINAGVADRAGFAGTFPDQAAGELEQLRLTFRRKAYLASLDRVARWLAAREFPIAVTLEEVPESAERSGLLRRRAALDLPCEPGSPLLLDEHGAPIPPERAAPWLRYARSVRVSIEGNAGFCRGLLTTRYPPAG